MHYALCIDKAQRYNKKSIYTTTIFNEILIKFQLSTQKKVVYLQDVNLETNII